MTRNSRRVEFLDLSRGGVGWGAKRPETTDTRRAEFVDLGGGGVGWVVG